MEVAKKSGYGCIVKEDKRSVGSEVEEEGCKKQIIPKVGNEDDNVKPSSKQNQKELTIPNNKDEQFESAKAEMGEVREENHRLRIQLDRIMKDYQTLQMQYHDIVQQQETAKNCTSTSSTTDQEMEETELVSLTLGRTSSDPNRVEKHKISSKGDKEGLALGLDCHYNNEVPIITPSGSSVNYASSENSLEEVKEEFSRKTWPPQKNLKTMRNGDQDEVLEQNPSKKTRVSVRARCNTPTMHDGCQWRKYGQKIAKGNPCPRAYYRCTISPNCPVRKQVQRCAQDMSILTTTYEGTHNHQLPISATAMASTTSAAASMLMSGSSTSGSSPTQSFAPTASTTTTTAQLHGLHCYLSENSKFKQFYPPNSSISNTPSHPTITLDLTSNPSSSQSHLINRIPTNFPSRYSSTNLNFSSLESNPLPSSWTNGVQSYGTQQPYNKNQIGSLSFGKMPQENLYLPYNMQNNILTSTQQSLPPDTITAATKALTSDPSFRSALAAALTSIIGSGDGGSGALGNHVGGEKLGQNLKLGEPFPVASNFPSASNNISKCSSSYLNKSSSAMNPQSGNLMFLPPNAFPFSTSKSKSTSPCGKRDDII